MNSELETYQSFSEKKLAISAIRTILIEAAADLSLRGKETPQFRITLDELATGHFPPEISDAQARTFKDSEKTMDWWARGRNLALIAAILLVDELSLHPNPEEQAQILGTRHMIVFETDPPDSSDRGTYPGYLIQDIPPDYIEEARSLAPKIVDVVKNSPDDSWMAPMTETDQVADRTSPLIAAAKYVREHGGPKLTSEKENIIKRYAAKK